MLKDQEYTYMEPLMKFSIILPILALLSFANFAEHIPLGHFCPNTTTFLSNSTYKTNLDRLLSSLSSNSTNSTQYYLNGFRNSSSGLDPDDVYGLFLCRGDVSTEVCRDCVREAFQYIVLKCPVEKVAIVWYDDCLLRYSNQSLFSTMDDSPTLHMENPGHVTEHPTLFDSLARTTLAQAARVAAAAPSGAKKFAVRQVNFTAYMKLFNLVQCTPDLSRLDCDSCLQEAISWHPTYSNGRLGGRVLFPSCNFRFEIYPFYNETLLVAQSPPSVVLPSPPPRTGGKSINKTRTIIAIVIPSASAVIVIFCICMFLRVRKPRKNVEIVDEIKSAEPLQFNFSTISLATNNFSEENKLGKGGFGVVFKGILSNGQEVAVKRLSKNSEQGDIEFKNEVLLVAKLQHRNLVSLLGFFLERNERILIYEFLPNTSLDCFIFDRVKRVYLDWERRYKIIVGISRGLIYLHEDSRLRIIHRDLKASNVLLDAEMNPKIADFGMARLFAMDQTQDNTSRIVGTYGYMAPEYLFHGQFSVKSDVYSFGVLILEIVSGQKNTSFCNGERVEDLLGYAWKNWRQGTSENVIDPILNTGSRTEMIRCIHIGLLCVQENAAARPTMNSVVLMLNSHSITLPVPSQPAYFVDSSIASDLSSSLQSKVDKVVPLSRNEVSITELHPR